jgi:LPS export ABC transporter protein LptC
MRKIILVLTAVLLFGGCGGGPEKASKAPAEESLSGADQQVMSFSLVGYEKSGKKKWEVEGKSADIMAEVVNLTTVVAKAYGDEVDMTLVADRGVFNRASNDVHFESNVVVTSNDGSVLSTEALDWKNDEEKIYSDKAVKITAKKPVTTIICDGPMEINYGKNYAEFNNKVKVDDERGQIYCDKAVAYYDSKTREVTKIVATGNVKIVRGGSWTFSDEAIYLAQEQKVILTGSPKVMIYPEETKPLPAGQGKSKEGI